MKHVHLSGDVLEKVQELLKTFPEFLKRVQDILIIFRELLKTLQERLKKVREGANVFRTCRKLCGVGRKGNCAHGTRAQQWLWFFMAEIGERFRTGFRDL
jgi:hypothetical protein